MCTSAIRQAVKMRGQKLLFKAKNPSGSFHRRQGSNQVENQI